MDQVNMEKFGAFVSELRKEKGLTQRELSERLFVSDKAVSKWERGLSLPNVSLLLPLAEVLGVTVTELLKGERMKSESLPISEVEQLVTRSLELSSDEQNELRKSRSKWIKRYIFSVIVSVGELFGLAFIGCDLEHMASSVFLVVLLNLISGGWFCIAAPDSLPAFYDEYPVSYVTDGIFKMHMAGMRFHNRNWPHIVRSCRQCLLFSAVGYPILYAIFEFTGLNRHFLFSLVSTLAASLGILILVYKVGKKYE